VTLEAPAGRDPTEDPESWDCRVDRDLKEDLDWVEYPALVVSQVRRVVAVYRV